MSLFDGYKLPDDERALEILQRISDLWEDNAGVRSICHENRPNPKIIHERVSAEIREQLIKLSTTSPQTLEDMLNQEVSLYNILQYAKTAMYYD
ncbi:MAG: hypothetical protein IJE68_03500 [Clostridia bacterium]|nr:hypothetical protein [Clostridia bacterium]